MRGGLALALHATRGPSPASELHAIEAILGADGADGEAATIKQIAAQTGISVQTVRRRLKLRSLKPALRDAFEQATIRASVAEAAARLAEREQEKLAQRLAQRGRLTLSEVRDFAREGSDEAKAELPGELFSDPEVPWQAIVRGHIIAALQALPKTEEQLAAGLKVALAQLERA